MILASINDLIRLTTSTTADIHFQTAWADITSTTFITGRTNGIITSETDTAIISSPLASTQRQIKEILISNRHASNNNTITLQQYDGTNYVTLYTYTLAAGYSIYYNGQSYIIIEPNTSNILNLIGVTSDPLPPASGNLSVYSKKICGKIMLKQVDPSGLDTPFQNCIWQNNTVLFTPAAAAGVWQGTVGANLGTPTIALPTLTNAATMLRRSLFPSVVTTTNQQIGTRTEAMFFRGNISGLGGFFMVTRFMLSKWTAGNRLFIGFCSGTTAIVTVQPSSLLNMLGFGVDAGDSAITFMHNDGAGICTKDAIAGQPALATNNGYVAYIFCKPNDSTVYYRLDDINTGTTIIDSSTNTDLPVNTTALTCQAIIGNGANVVANDANIGINRIYIETDI